MKRCTPKHRKLRNIIISVGLLLMTLVFIGFLYYAVRYSFTIFLWEDGGLQSYNGICTKYGTHYISSSREMFYFCLENGDTARMPSILLRETSFDEDTFRNLVENQVPLQISYTKFYMPSIFRKYYGLVSMKLGKEIIIPDTIMHREILGSAIIFAVVWVFMCSIPVACFLQKKPCKKRSKKGKKRSRK